MLPRNCNFCGLCCTLMAEVKEHEIRAIERLGYSRSGFTEKDFDNNAILKRNGGWRFFLERKNGVGVCKIYSSRPDICNDFPGKKLCDLRDNVFFPAFSEHTSESKAAA